MALTTQTSDSYPGLLCHAMRRAGLTHLTHLEREIRYQMWGAHWFWRTESGNIGDFKTADLVPTPEELTAMFAAIKLTD